MHVQLRSAGSLAEGAEMAHEPYGQIEHARHNRSVHGVGAKSTAVMRLNRIDVHANDVRRRQIDLDTHVSHAWMLVPLSLERGTIGGREGINRR